MRAQEHRFGSRYGKEDRERRLAAETEHKRVAARTCFGLEDDEDAALYFFFTGYIS